MPLTREEAIEKYGEDALIEEQSSRSVNHLKSAVVGAASIPTDFINFFPTVYDAAKAGINSYRNDTKFVEEFAKEQQIPEAQDNTQAHLDQIAASWRQADPGLSDDDINKGLADYQKTKDYEDFARQQLSGTAWLAATTKDIARRALGDERPESERSWTEGAAEAVGGALVPGPAGWATAARTAVTGVPVVGRAANSLIGRGTLRTAEALTPLTMPYTGTNVAINAAAGIALDQAGRGLQGKPTAFTPDNEDPNGVGALFATSAGVLALAAIVGAVKGRSHQVLQKSHTANELAASPGLDQRVAAQPRTGETIIEAGDPQQRTPPASLEQEGVATQVGRSGINQYVDESRVAIKAIDDIYNDPKVTEHFEELYTSNSGAVLNDKANALTETYTRPLRDALAAMHPEEARAAKAGLVTANYDAYWHHVYDTQAKNLSDLQSELARAKSTRSRNALTQKINDIVTNLQRFVDDNDRSARLMLPDLPMSQIRRQAVAFHSDKSPKMMAVKKAAKEWADRMLDMQVMAQKMTRKEANELRARNPYYVPIINDPLKGATGVKRLFKSMTSDIRNAMTSQSRGTGGHVMRETPIERLDTKIPPPYDPKLAETRVTALLDPESTIKMYTERNIKDVAHTMMRNEFSPAFYEKSPGVLTDFAKDGHIRKWYFQGREWHPVNAQKEDEVKAAFDNPRFVPEWQDGRFRLWEYGDVEIPRMLRQEPIVMNGMIKGMAHSARIFKFFTTGRGNYAFAPMGAVYDLTVGIITRNASRAFGPLSTLAYRTLPERFARATVGRVIDPSAIVMAPAHSLRAIADITTAHTSRWIAGVLKRESPIFQAVHAAVGDRAYNAMINTAMKVANAVDQSATMTLLRHGAARGSGAVDNVASVRNHYSMVRDSIPQPIKNAWQFYTDVLDAIYLGPKRMFYTENYGLLAQKYKGKIPKAELDKLIDETRTLGGNMTKVAASKTMRDVEAITPYLTQTKLGAYHLYRNMFSKETAPYVLPRMALMMYAAGQSMYWRTYWNQESADELWKYTPEHQRWRFISVPTVELLMAWARGENPAYDRKLYYKVPLPPDFTPIIAGTGALMQMFGMIPASATPRPMVGDLPKTILDSHTPAMPPAIQSLLAASGMKLDPQTADVRGGSLIRSFNSTFRSGPQAESSTNLGEQSNAMSLFMNAAFGAFGSHFAIATDVLMHASKFKQDGSIAPSPDFGRGLRLATTEVLQRSSARLPDIPLLWQNKDRYSITTPAWQYVKQQEQHLNSLKGVVNESLGPRATEKQAIAEKVGGIGPQRVKETVLLQVAQVATAWQNQTGPLGKLRHEYDDLAAANRSISIQYNLPWSERTSRGNQIVRMMQDNMHQQHLSIKFLEQQIEEKFGPALAPFAQGRGINLESLDQMMHENRE
jgi:hypothetical protein